MDWNTIQQLVRIALYAIGGAVFGDGFADSEMYQAFIGGALAVGAFVWWFVWERQTVHKVAKVVAFLAVLFAASQFLIACEASYNAEDQAYCKETYTAEAACVDDAKCEWKLKEDGEGTCRAKRSLY